MGTAIYAPSRASTPLHLDGTYDIIVTFSANPGRPEFSGDFIIGYHFLWDFVFVCGSDQSNIFQ